jgi:hypothetical protein
MFDICRLSYCVNLFHYKLFMEGKHIFICARNVYVKCSVDNYTLTDIWYTRTKNISHKK